MMRPHLTLQHCESILDRRLNLRIKHQLDAEYLRNRLTRQIICRRPQPAGGNHQIRMLPGLQKGTLNFIDIIHHHPVASH